MNAYRNFALIAIAATAFALLTPNASAEIPIQKLRVTVLRPVEVPNLVLPIGTYIFEALENGRVTRIISADENRVYATLLTQPDERREPVDSAVITFKETPKGALERIDSWFFAGESIGSEFLYPATPADGKSRSKLNSFTREAGRSVEVATEDALAIPEYLARWMGTHGI